jgi:hypothetical protein
LAQSTFEGGALYRDTKYADYWLRDSHGAVFNMGSWMHNSTAAPSNCRCLGYSQDAPGPLWDFRQPRVRAFFMDQMVTPMITSAAVDGIFFDDALNIPNYCMHPPHGSASCTGSFTVNAQDQAHVAAGTLAHFDTVLGAMAAQDKGVVMSMNPVSDASSPINTTSGDGLLKKHGAFHFWESFCSIAGAAPGNEVAGIPLALELGAAGHLFLLHAAGASGSFAAREYCFAAYLVVATEWSYYGVSEGWLAGSFPWYEEYGKPLGQPTGPAHVLGGGRYFRDFEHLNVTIDTTAHTASVTWKPPIPQPPPPPPIPPPPPSGPCAAWGCTCQGVTDTYGTEAGIGFGCAPVPAQTFWRQHRCTVTKASPCTDPPVQCGTGRPATHGVGCCPGCN